MARSRVLKQRRKSRKNSLRRRKGRKQVIRYKTSRKNVKNIRNKLRKKTARRGRYRTRKPRRRFNGRRRGRQEDEVTGNEIEGPEDQLAVETVEVPETIEELEEMLEEPIETEEEAEAVMAALGEAMQDPELKDVIDANGDGIPDWCNWRKPMGAWLNFRNMKVWCADKGFKNFGPYGGVPVFESTNAVDTQDDAGNEVEDEVDTEVEENGDDAAVDDLVDEPVEYEEYESEEQNAV